MAAKTFNDKLKFCNYKLETLLTITQSINNNESIVALLAQFKQLLYQDLKIANILLYSHAPTWQALMVFGKGEAVHDKIDINQHLLPFKAISTTNYDKDKLFDGFDMIIPVYHKSEPLAFLLIGDSDVHPGMSYSIKHLQFIQTITNIILVAIENKRLAKAQSKQDAFVADMNLAARMQKLLIPTSNEFPRNKSVEAAAFYKPHLFVGGDFYDFVKLSRYEYGFAIADVTGKGVSAALLMSNLQANLKTHFTARVSLSNLVHILNQKVIDIADGDRFITMFLGRYNSKTNTLDYINAGHIPPMLHTKGSELQYLSKGCVGLGMLDVIPAISPGFVQIQTPTRIICYTDGLAEVKQGNEVIEQYKHIETCAKSSLNIDDAMHELTAPISAANYDEELFDDISVIGIDLL